MSETLKTKIAEADKKAPAIRTDKKSSGASGLQAVDI